MGFTTIHPFPFLSISLNASPTPTLISYLFSALKGNLEIRITEGTGQLRGAPINVGDGVVEAFIVMEYPWMLCVSTGIGAEIFNLLVPFIMAMECELKNVCTSECG